MSKFTDEDLKEIADKSLGMDAELARELLSLRSAGDEEVDSKVLEISHWIDNEAKCPMEREACNSAVRDLQDLRDIATLTAERDEARSELEDAQRQEIETIAAVINHRKLIDEQKQKIDFLTAELAALTSCPAMEEVDALSKSAMETLAQIMLNATDSPAHAVDATPPGRITKMRDLIDAMRTVSRRSIASREEVVGLLKWLWTFKEVREIVQAQAEQWEHCDDHPEARKIIMIVIVEGK